MKDTIIYEGKEYSNAPKDVYTKRGRKPIYYRLPEYKDSETIVFRIETYKHQLKGKEAELDKLPHSLYSSDEGIEIASRIGQLKGMIETNETELKDRLCDKPENKATCEKSIRSE